MLSSEQILENVAQDGSLDIGEWPRVLESLLQRLHDIVHNEFPLPSLPLPAALPSTIDPEVVASTPPELFHSEPPLREQDLPDADDNDEPQANSQDSTKENDAPTDVAAARPPVPTFEITRTPHPAPPPDSIETPSGTLPPDLLSLYNSSTRVLQHDFAKSPPYTIQRLAELALYPKKHYRFLPAYLRALDRIVSVSSPASDFPLPSLNHSPHGGFLTNGDTTHANGISDRDSLGSDESLGGALLTPIPWLRNNALGHTTSQQSNGDSGEFRSEHTETIEGPNGAGSIETVSVTINGVPSATSVAHTSPAPISPTLSEQSDASSSSSSGPTEAEMREQGAVTQGELLRQEQEAGVIPLSQSSHRRPLLAAGAVAVGREPPSTAGGAARMTAESVEDRAPEDSPHARGPEEIGMEDMGPQHTPLDAGLDMEAAVGRGRSKSPQPPAAVVESSMVAEAEAEQAGRDDAGAAGQDPADAQMEEGMAEDVENARKERQARDAEGDTIVADADGVETGESEKLEHS